MAYSITDIPEHNYGYTTEAIIRGNDFNDYLSVVMAYNKKSEKYGVWMFNHDTNAMYYGLYTTDQAEAMLDFERRANKIRS